MAEEEQQNTDTLDTGAAAGDGGTPAGEAAEVSSQTDGEAPAGDILDNKGESGADSSSTGDVLSDDDAAGDEGVPDQYDLDLEKLGVEGAQLNEEQLEGYKAIAKDMGLTQQQFEGLAKYDIERAQAANAEAVDEWNSRVNGWRESARTDKEFGGKEYETNVKNAMKVVEQFGDDDLKALLKSPSEDNPDGLAIGNHPAVLRTLNRIGKALSDPDLVLGDDVEKSDDTDARLKRLYPSMYDKSA